MVAYVNAWQDDLSSDPLTTVMAAMNSAIDPHLDPKTPAEATFKKAKHQLGIIAAEGGKQVALHALKAITGISLSKIIEVVNDQAGPDLSDEITEGVTDASKTAVEKAVEKAADALIEDRLALHEQSLKSIKNFRTSLAETLTNLRNKKHIPLPLFVFVDELDRCRPLYAIKLLEEMKHLFEISGIVFVVATDSQQLCHSIRAVYGNEFDARKYLRKFFDRTYVFRQPKKHNFVKNQFDKRGIKIDSIFYNTNNIPPLNLIVDWAKHFDLSQRDIIQCVDIIITAYTSWPYPVPFEPVRFLALLWSIFSASNTDTENIENLKGSEYSPLLASWNLPVSRQTRPEGITISAPVKATNIINTWNGILKDDLEDIVNARTRDQLHDFFRNEYMNIYNKSGKSLNPGQKSVVTTYRDLIAAAGYAITS